MQREGIQTFCTTDEEKLEQVDPIDASDIQTDTKRGVARYHLLWDVKHIPVLRVHFLNPEILENEGWTCGHKQLTVNNVLDWATFWNSHAEKYPKIADEEATKDEADIRVEFTSDSEWNQFIIIIYQALESCMHAWTSLKEMVVPTNNGINHHGINHHPCAWHLSYSFDKHTPCQFRHEHDYNLQKK